MIVKKAVPFKLIKSKMSIKTKKPMVTWIESLSFSPRIERTFLTTPVAITPQAIPEETKRVTPINRPALSPKAALV